MLVFQILFGLLALFPIGIPLLIAKYDTQSPRGVRTVLSIAGSVAAAYAAIILVLMFLPGAQDIGVTELLIGTTAISFYFSLGGVLVVALAGYAVSKRLGSAGGIFALFLFLCVLALGVFLVFPFILAPLHYS